MLAAARDVRVDVRRRAEVRDGRIGRLRRLLVGALPRIRSWLRDAPVSADLAEPGPVDDEDAIRDSLAIW